MGDGGGGEGEDRETGSGHLLSSRRIGTPNLEGLLLNVTIIQLLAHDNHKHIQRGVLSLRQSQRRRWGHGKYEEMVRMGMSSSL